MFVLRDVARPFALSLRRAFHLTPSRRSVGKKEALDKILRDSPSFSQLTNDPVAVTAITDLAKVLQQQGCCDFFASQPESDNHNRYRFDFGKVSISYADDSSDDATRLPGGYQTC